MRSANPLSGTHALLFALFAASALAGAALFFALPHAHAVYAQWSRERALDGCNNAEVNADIQIECIFGVLTELMQKDGVGATMDAFTLAYQKFPEFVSGGCHRQAHRVGDLAYYQRYLGEENLARIDLPQSTTACGYGFYHGFMEHLIQDHPRPEFVDEVCTYLTDRLGATMGDIRLTCYHGAGHGFELAHIETLNQSQWGDFALFTEKPAALCRKLTKANPVDVEQCIEGVFNVIVDAMDIKQFGFSYDEAHPFRRCDTAAPGNVQACYYEMAQKLDRVSDLDPVKLAGFADQALTPQLSAVAFRVGTAGIVQQIILREHGYQDLLRRCGELSDERFTECLQSVVNGLYEHGEPQEEYKKALTACDEHIVEARGKMDMCHATVAIRLPRFYPEARIAEICAEFPERYRASCLRDAASRQGVESRSV